MNAIFNVVILKCGKDDCSYVKEPLDDFINHLDWSTETLHIYDYANCVQVRADYQNGDSLSLIFDSSMSNKVTIANTATNINFCLLNRHNLNLEWDYDNKGEESLNYKDMLTKENSQRVIDLRQELYQSVRRDDNEYVNVLSSTQRSIKKGAYKVLSDYQVNCAFMDAIRGACEMPPRRPLILKGDDKFVGCSPKGQQTDDCSAQTELDVSGVEKSSQVQSYFSDNDNKRHKQDASRDFYGKPNIPESKKHNKQKPQKSLDDFMF